MDASTIWALRKPVQWLWRKLTNCIGAWTVEPVFRQAHEYHVALRRWQRRWVELAKDVEYKLYTRSSFDEEENAQSVLVRNSANTIIDEIHFCVEAKLGSLSYQIPLVVHRLKPGCTAVLSLHGLPLQDLTVHDNGIVATYDSIHVYPVRIVRADQVEIYATDGIPWHASYDDYLNGEWKRWDGRLYNVKALRDKRRDTFVRLAHWLCWRHGLIGFTFAMLLGQALRARHYRRLPGILTFALVSSGPVLGAILWSRLLLRIDRIVFESDPISTAAVEHVQLKGQSSRPIRTIPINAYASLN